MKRLDINQTDFKRNTCSLHEHLIFIRISCKYFYYYLFCVIINCDERIECRCFKNINAGQGWYRGKQKKIECWCWWKVHPCSLPWPPMLENQFCLLTGLSGSRAGEQKKSNGFTQHDIITSLIVWLNTNHFSPRTQNEITNVEFKYFSYFLYYHSA